jgi:tripartite-type tricarboxylate transporter receptor subunit TctC
MLSRFFNSLMFASFALAFTPAAFAQNYPDRSIRWVVPAPPGANNDIFARLVAQHLSKALGQPVVIDNRPGAGSIVATENVAKSPPDGYTILMTPSSIVISETLYKELPYNMLRDFTGIAMLAEQPLVVVVNPSSGIATLKDLIARARANPGKLNYGSGGSGTPQHLATEMFGGLAGVNIVHVSYKGSTGAITDLLAKQIDFMIEPAATVIPHIKNGSLRALAVTTSARSPLIPDVPTAVEAGLPGFVLKTWYGVLARAGTPRGIVERLGTEISAIMRMPEVEQAFAKQGATTVVSSPREFDEFLRSEIKTWGKLVKDANVTIN